MTSPKDRHTRLERILKVQVQKRKIEEWRLSHLKQARAEIERSDIEVLDSLNVDSALHGLFVDAKVKTLRRNDLARRDNEKLQDETGARLAEAKRREKGVEKRRDDASRDADGEAEAKALGTQVESFLARLSTSLG